MVESLELTVRVVTAYVSQNRIPAADLPALISSVSAALGRLTNGGQVAAPEPQKPAVPLKKSVTPEHIVCLEDGKKFRSLKKHLALAHGMTPGEYRAKWHLPSDYPIVAPEYAARRSELAKAAGLGRPGAKAAPFKRGRRKAT